MVLCGPRVYTIPCHPQVAIDQNNLKNLTMGWSHPKNPKKMPDVSSSRLHFHTHDGSMGLVYLPTALPQKLTKCRWIYWIYVPWATTMENKVIYHKITAKNSKRPWYIPYMDDMGYYVYPRCRMLVFIELTTCPAPPRSTYPSHCGCLCGSWACSHSSIDGWSCCGVNLPWFSSWWFQRFFIFTHT